jgi:hypothetical protein
MIRNLGFIVQIIALFFLTTMSVNAQTLLAKVELIKNYQKKVFKNLLSDAPQPVMYYAKQGNMPSCGLIANPNSLVITQILETDPVENFPYCLEVSEGAQFEFNGNKGYVFKYLQKDTREDTSTAYFFVQRSSTGELISLNYLNGETIPSKKSIQQIADWAKLKLSNQKLLIPKH